MSSSGTVDIPLAFQRFANTDDLVLSIFITIISQAGGSYYVLLQPKVTGYAVNRDPTACGNIAIFIP
jgi:hypothetical protein